MTRTPKEGIPLKNRKGIAWLIAMVSVFSLFAAACGSSDSGSEGADTSGLGALNGKIDGGGSSFQDTFQQKVSTGFDDAVAEAGGDTTVTYTKSGSSDGKKALADNTLNFAGSDSAIKD